MRPFLLLITFLLLMFLLYVYWKSWIPRPRPPPHCSAYVKLASVRLTRRCSIDPYLINFNFIQKKKKKAVKWTIRASSNYNLSFLQNTYIPIIIQTKSFGNILLETVFIAHDSLLNNRSICLRSLKQNAMKTKTSSKMGEQQQTLIK